MELYKDTTIFGDSTVACPNVAGCPMNLHIRCRHSCCQLYSVNCTLLANKRKHDTLDSIIRKKLQYESIRVTPCAMSCLETEQAQCSKHCNTHRPRDQLGQGTPALENRPTPWQQNIDPVDDAPLCRYAPAVADLIKVPSLSPFTSISPPATSPAPSAAPTTTAAPEATITIISA